MGWKCPRGCEPEHAVACPGCTESGDLLLGVDPSRPSAPIRDADATPEQREAWRATDCPPFCGACGAELEYTYPRRLRAEDTARALARIARAEAERRAPILRRYREAREAAEVNARNGYTTTARRFAAEAAALRREAEANGVPAV